MALRRVARRARVRLQRVPVVRKVPPVATGDGRREPERPELRGDRAVRQVDRRLLLPLAVAAELVARLAVVARAAVARRARRQLVPVLPRARPAVVRARRVAPRFARAVGVLVAAGVRAGGVRVAGFLADRVGAGRMTVASFALIAAGSTILASGTITAGLTVFFILAVVGTSLGVFALRGLYFAIMKEGKIPLAFTGSAVGFVSLIGYTPDVFMGPLMGWLLDRSPGATGHQDVFAVVTGFALLGIVVSVMFQRMTRR